MNLSEVAQTGHTRQVPWLVISGVVVWLRIVAELGARLAHRLDERKLRRVLIGLVSAMAIYMACQALV